MKRSKDKDSQRDDMTKILGAGWGAQLDWMVKEDWKHFIWFIFYVGHTGCFVEND